MAGVGVKYAALGLAEPKGGKVAVVVGCWVATSSLFFLAFFAALWSGLRQ